MSTKTDVWKYLRDHDLSDLNQTEAARQAISDLGLEKSTRSVRRYVRYWREGEGKFVDDPQAYIEEGDEAEQGEQKSQDQSSEKDTDPWDWFRREVDNEELPPGFDFADEEHEDVDNPESSDVALIDWQNRKYHFKLNNASNCVLTFEEASAMVRAYVHAGSGLTRKDVATWISGGDFIETVGEEYVDEAPELRHRQVKRVFWALNVQKSSLPFAPHEYKEKSVDELTDKWRTQAEAAVARRYREKQSKHWKKKYRKEVQKRIEVERMVGEITEHLQGTSIRIDVEPTSFDGTLEPIVPVVMAQDWHFGALVESKSNRFDKDVARDRVREFGAGIERWLRRQDRPIDELHIAVNGDIVDGPVGNMRSGHQAEQDLYYDEQTSEAAKALAEMVARLRGTLPDDIDIEVHCVTGNHGRGTEDRQDDPARVPELCVYQIAEALTKDLNVTWDRCRDVVNEWSVYSTQVLQTHGDRTPKNLDKVIRANMDKSAEWHMLVRGHYHHEDAEEKWDQLVVQGGSLIGADCYARHQRGVGTRPSQRIVEVRRSGPVLPGQIPLS